MDAEMYTCCAGESIVRALDAQVFLFNIVRLVRILAALVEGLNI